MGLFLAGMLAGGFLATLVVGFLYLSARRDNVRMDEEKQRLEEEQKIVVNFMHSLVEASGAGAKRETLYQHIVHASILSTGAMSACIFERTREGRLRGVAVEGLFPPLKPLIESPTEGAGTRARFIEQILKSEVFEMGDGLIGGVAKERKALLIRDARKDPRVVHHQDPALEVRSLILSPMVAQHEVLGILAVANPSDGLGFSDSEFSLIQSLAEQAAMAIHNSDLVALQIEKNKLDLDLSIASSIQGMLLPREFPVRQGLDLDAVYRPAQKVGGDLYDIFQIDGNRIGLAIADVSGKGIAASLLMAICQTHLRHYARQIDSPSAVLRAMNHELANEMRSDMFITLIFAIIDLQAHTLTFARAGHELPLLVHASGHPAEVEHVPSEGMALGMVPREIFDAVIEDKTVSFIPGDVLVLYTDGVTEVTNPAEEEFSCARLGEEVRRLRDCSASELNRSILGRLEEFGGKHSGATDDITLITARRV